MDLDLTPLDGHQLALAKLAQDAVDVDRGQT
jgi:hypothetical protein